jgi:putative tryptophan/tyrosine transport system substrate-binding protein
MKRRSFIAGGALSLCLAGAHAQSDAPRRLGWLMPSPPASPKEGMPFIEALANLGWVDGKTIQIERCNAGDPADPAATLEARAKEIVALQPDVIFTASSPAVDALRHETRTIPIVFIGVNNPVGADFVASLAHPGGNITGFANVEPTVAGKMIELLTEIAPRTRNIAFVYSSTYTSFKRDWILSQEATDQAAKSYSVGLSYVPVADEREIDRVFAKLGEDQATAAIVLADVYLLQRPKLVVASAARYRVPAIFPFPVFPSVGGLMSYGSKLPDQFREAAGYVDRILKGANPGDLPVQMPTEYELVINMKAATALGISVPPSLLSTADRVIE